MNISAELLMMIWVVLSACHTTDKVFKKYSASCESFDQSVLPGLQQDLDTLEAYFIQEGVLTDGSGPSFYQVYEQIAKEDDFLFSINRDFPVLDTLPPHELQRCYWRALAPSKLTNADIRYLKTLYKMSQQRSRGNITPGVVAQGIVDKMKPDDFNSEFLKTGALLTLYLISSPYSPSLNVNPGTPDSALSFAELRITANNEMMFNQTPIDIAQITQKVKTFVLVSPHQRGIRIATDRETLYESYLLAFDSVKKAYVILREEAATQTYQQPFDQLNEAQQVIIQEQIPQYITIDSF